MKKEYVEPEVMIIKFESTDGICTSGECEYKLPEDD